MPPLRVAIDAHNLSLAEGTGIATYTRNLETALHGLGAEVHALFGMRQARGDLPPEVGFFDGFRAGPARGRLERAAAAARRAAALAAHVGRSTVRARPIAQDGIVDRRHVAPRLPRAAAVHNADRLFDVAPLRFRLTGNLLPVELGAKVDVFHATCPLPITMNGVARVCTIHDLIPLTLPFTTLDRKESYWRLVRRIAADYHLLFAVSTQTKQDLVRVLGVPEERIHVTWQGIDVAPTADDAGDTAVLLGRSFGLASGGYLLFVGAVEPKKNVARLLEAYLASGVTLPLVLAGPDGWLVDQELRLLPFAGRDGRVLRLRYPSRTLLLQLYRGARALIFPSLSEGFGLPALEAMALGCPVVAGRAGALPETCGDAALFVDPFDVAAIAAALRAVCEQPELCARLAAEGRRQAARFSMDEYRRRLESGYQKALARAR